MEPHLFDLTKGGLVHKLLRHGPIYLTGSPLYKTLDQPQIHFGVWDVIQAMWQNLLFHTGPFFPYLPKFRTYAKARKLFQRTELEELTRRYSPYLEKFYRNNPLTRQDIEELDRINSNHVSVESKNRNEL